MKNLNDQEIIQFMLKALEPNIALADPKLSTQEKMDIMDNFMNDPEVSLLLDKMEGKSNEYCR